MPSSAKPTKFRERWRSVFSCGAALTGAALLWAFAPNAAAASRTITVTEATDMAATVSPDHSTIVMDVQGVLWSMPASGGAAKQLTALLLEPARPDWSPRGDAVAFEAYAGGTFHIWTMKPDGTASRQLTFGHGDDRDPKWSPDGTRIAFASDRAFKGNYDIWVLDVASGNLTQITSSPLEEFEPTWSPDGSQITFASGTTTAISLAGGQQIETIALASGARTTLVTAPAGARLNSPTWSPDGSKLAYLQFANNKSQLMVSGTRVGTSNDVFPFYANWLSNSEVLYTADGRIWVTDLGNNSTREIPFSTQFTVDEPQYAFKPFNFDTEASQRVNGIVSPALSPDGRHVVFEALNQLWVMPIGETPQKITNDSYFKVDPTWSPDGTRIAYSSDRSGTEQIYIRNLASGAEEQVTALPGASVSPAWSPDGSMLAFHDQNGATFIVDIATGNVRQVIGALFAPGRPTWSGDGSTIAFAALKPYSHRFREGTSQILTVNIANATFAYTEPAPFKSFSTRGDDGPVISPDGTAMAAVMEDVLWIIPVDPSGHPTGPAKQINHEVTDAVSWSGDSQHLLYLSNGHLHLIGRDGSGLKTIPVQLSWHQDVPHGRTVIHAGRLWDGLGPQVQTDVDVIVINNRIASIQPHSAASQQESEDGDQFVDATDLTVLPGLWESHTHQFIEGKFYGDRLGRLWLAYGVTTLESVGDPVYRAVETREAYSSASRVGPRYFATGEAIDGERIYYNFMRPTTSVDQLNLSLSRARALGYDMVKTYVRLPHAMQQIAARFAHDEMGVWTASHYMLPGMSLGMDGMAHVSATTRLGFAYTRSAAGVSYRDMIDVFSTPGLFDISTTFNSSLYAEDPTMVDDPRLQILNTPWDQQGLVLKRNLAVSTDQTVSLDSLRKEEATVAAIRHNGGIVLAGTDSPLDNVATALHLNLRSQVKFGLAPWEALQSATLLTARAYHKENDLGSLQPGKLADMVFVSGNPLETIADVANVQMVMKNGRLYRLSELEAPFTPSGLAEAGANSQPARGNRVLSPIVDDAAAKAKYWWHDPALMGDECAPER
jgi:Tol biopolymer transport system component